MQIKIAFFIKKPRESARLCFFEGYGMVICGPFETQGALCVPG